MIVPAIGRNGTGIARPVRYGLPDMELCGPFPIAAAGFRHADIARMKIFATFERYKKKQTAFL